MSLDILQKIIDHKRQEVNHRKALYPEALLKESIFFETPVVSMRKYLQRADKTGIIAEFKRRSPSKGNINPYASVEQVSIGYMQAGASAISVLTDSQFFGGKNDDLIEARKFNFCPVLRKDFIIDPYQVIETRSIGADTMLLIAECLSKTQLHDLAALGKSLGMEILMEMHSEKEIEKICPEVDLIGVNNRDLQNFEVDIQRSLELYKALPKDKVIIAESGLQDPETICIMKEEGFEGFLIGEYFMKHAEPHKACENFIREIEFLSRKQMKV